MELLALLGFALLLWLLIAPILALAKASSAKNLARENQRRLDEWIGRFHERERAAMREGPPAGIQRPDPADSLVPEKQRLVPASEEKLPAAEKSVLAATDKASVQQETAPIPPPLPAGHASGAQEDTESVLMDAPVAGFNWEMFMGAKLFAWIGGLAFFIGVSFLLKYSMEHGWITPVMRAISGFSLGLGLIAGGLHLGRERYEVMRHSLCATGILVLYAVTYACRSLWHLDMFTQPVSFGVMSLVTAGAFLLAVRLEARVVAVLGLFGGFLTPVLLSTGVDNPYGLFGYVALLNAGLLAVMLRKRWNFLPPLGAAGTLVLQAGWWNAFFDRGGYSTDSRIFIPMAVFAGMPALFACALWIAKRRNAIHGTLTGSTAVLLGAGFVAGCSFVFTPALAANPTISFGYIFVLEAILLLTVAADRRVSFAIPAAGAAVFLLLATWMFDELTVVSLTKALIVFFVFGLLHTVIPMVLKKRGKIAGVPAWCHAGPVLTLLLAAFSVTRISSPLVWLLLLAANALALGLAVFTRRAIPFAGALILTLVSSGFALEHVNESGGGLTPWLFILMGVTIFFISSAFILRRALVVDDDTPLAEQSPDTAVITLLPSASVLMPFVLLAMAIDRVALPDPGPVFIFGAALAVALLVLCRTLRAAALAPATLLGVTLLEGVWFTLRFDHINAASSLLWSLGFCSSLFLFPFVCGKTFTGKRPPWIAAALSLVAHFGLIRGMMLREWPHALQPGVLPLLFAIPAFVGLALRLAGTTKENPALPSQLAWFAGTGLLFVTTAIGLQFQRESLTLAWALEGFALVTLFRKIPHRGLLTAGLALLGIGFMRLALNPAVLGYHIRGDAPLLNWYLYAYPIVTFALAGAAWKLRKEDRSRNGLPVAGALRAMALTLLFILLNLEIADWFSEPGTRVLVFTFTGNLARDMTYSLGWGLFALALLVAGIIRRNRPARITSMALILISLAKLFFHDLASLDELYRIGAFIGLSLIAGIASFLYQKFSAENREA